MTEKMLKVKVEELSTVRLVFGNGVVHEIPLDSVGEYAADKKTDPSVEFALPVQR